MGFRFGIFEHVNRHDNKVERRASIYPRNDVGRGIKMDRKLVAAGFLELRSEPIQQAGDGAAGDNLEFTGHGGRRQQRQAQCGGDRQRLVHDTLVVTKPRPR